MASIALPMIVDEGVASYLESVKKFPVLSTEDEYMLAKRYQENQDLAAAHKLVTSHLRLAAKIAFKYRNYGLSLADLISEANIGLMTAIKKFNPDKGFRLSTYAVWWIRAELHDFILRSWSLVRLGTVAAQKRLFYNLNKIKAQLGIYDKASLSDETVSQIASSLSVEEKEVRDMEVRMSGDVSLNAPVFDDEGNAEMGDFISDNAPNQEAMLSCEQEIAYRRKMFSEALLNLNERERDILLSRRMREEPLTLEELSNKYSISRERVRQVEQAAFDKVCAFIKEQA